MQWKGLTAVVAVCCLALSAGGSAFAQSADEMDTLSVGTTISNVPERANTVGIVTDEAGSTSLQLTSELASMAADDLRVVPIAGLGPLQNLNDLMHLKGVDAAIVQADVLDYARRNSLVEDIDQRLRFVARLHNREFHLIARSELRDIASLNGKRVNVGPAGSGTAITAAAIFEAAGLSVTPTRHPHQAALHLIKTGQIDAMVYVGGKPVPFLQHLDPADGLKLLQVPFSAALPSHYRPGQIDHRDYRGLMPVNGTIETVSVGAAIVAFNWPSKSRGYDRLKRFSEVLFGNIAALQTKPRHDKWQSVNLAAVLPGWQRHAAAQQGLEQTASTKSAGGDEIERLRASFKAVLHTRPAKTEQ